MMCILRKGDNAMKQKKMIAIFCTVALCVGALFGCADSSQEVFSVNGEKITQEKFSFFLESMKEMIALESDLEIVDENSWSTIEIDNKKAIDVAKQKALDDVVSLIVQVQKAKSEGIVLTDDDLNLIKAQKQKIILQYGGEKNFKQKLAGWSVSSEEFDKIMQDYMYASKLEAKYKAENEKINTITEEEILAKYNTIKEESIRESIFAKHILIMVDRATDTKPALTQQQAREQVQTVLTRLDEGEEFDIVMREMSYDIEASYEGYSFVHNDGQFDSIFDNAAYALEIGEVSQPVETQYGYHIIKRLPSKSEIAPLENVRQTVIDQIKTERYGFMVLNEWAASATIVKREKIFDLLK